MNLYIDTEFNGFGGELISMGIVSEEGEEFYECLECNNPVPWVEENVIPVLNKQPVSKIEFRVNLALFLNRFDEINVFADWPEDIVHFCRCLIINEGTMLDIGRRACFQIINVESKSLVPHNALADAIAIRKAVNSNDIRGIHGSSI